MMSRNKWGINKKTLTSIIIFTLLLTLLLGVSGAVPYEDRTMRYIYDTGTVIGDTDPIVALLFVDTNMEDILSIINSYVLHMVLISLVILAIFCVIHCFFMNKCLITPLVQISDNVRNYAQGKPMDRESLEKLSVTRT